MGWRWITLFRFIVICKLHSCRGSESQAVRADKDVFLELADMVGDDSLE